MFSSITVTMVICLYVGVLFAVALWGERQSKRAVWLSNNGITYSLSIAVYCTSWTYYGNVGKAATSGILFLGTYAGPTLAIIFWWVILRKLIRIKNKYRITSIADFISSRYNKSQSLAALVTIMILVGVVPYIALQLKAVNATFQLMVGIQDTGVSGMIQSHIAPLVVVLMIGFTILFGVRRLDPTERHRGMVLALATECIVKLIAFMAAGIFVTYYLFDGFGDIFQRFEAAQLSTTIGGDDKNPSFTTWSTMTILAMSAILFLPRQFHVAVVENSNENHVRKAQWMFPLYMLLINLFIIPMALAGLLLGHPANSAETFVLLLPLESGPPWLAMMIFIGGFSAATGMIMISAMTLSTMVTNHLVLPAIERFKRLWWLRRHLLQCRWSAVAVFVLSGYLFARNVGDSYMLMHMGMMSFAAVLQFAPAIVGGLFWRRGNHVGAMAGLSVGFALWIYTLLLPSFVKSGWLTQTIISDGLWGLSILRPEQLLGIEGLDQFSHAVFWTMSFNIGFYVLGSVLTKPDKEEQDLADDFVSILESGEEPQAAVMEVPSTVILDQKYYIIESIFSQYFSADKAQTAARQCIESVGLMDKERVTLFELTELQSEAERVLSGSIGAASAHNTIKSAGLFTDEEIEQLSTIYAEIFAELKVKPADLRKKVDYYKEREALMQSHTNDLERKVRERTKELQHTNEHLTTEIEERKKSEADRAVLQDKLVETSRRVGMAEVATSVLHNVGNVLTSVNVLTSGLMDKLQDSKIIHLNKTVALIQEHIDDLPVFLTEDQKGKMIPGFLNQVAQHLSAENETLAQDVTELAKNIEHIKEIIATQQGFAKISGVLHPTALEEIVDDAFRINSAGFSRHGLDFIKKIETDTLVLVDKPKIVQILVNLFSNAKYAISQNGKKERQLHVQVSQTEDGLAQISVTDNGIGIAKENLTNIFQYGFTTKKEGHGFGLHTSALAAKEMGGHLTVHSNGLGTGATFTLSLPTN